MIFIHHIDYRRIRCMDISTCNTFCSSSIVDSIYSLHQLLLNNRCKHKRLHKNNLSVSAHRLHSRSILIFLASLMAIFIFITYMYFRNIYDT